MITPLRIIGVICGLVFSISLNAQFATNDPYAKQIDAYVEGVGKTLFTDSVLIPGSNPQLAAMSPPGDIVGYYEGGQLKAIVSKFVQSGEGKFEVSYFFRNDSLIYIYMEYAESADYLGAGFYIVQYTKAHYFKNGVSLYWNNAGSGKAVPESYTREPADLKRYADIYISELKAQKK